MLDINSRIVRILGKNSQGIVGTILGEVRLPGESYDSNKTYLSNLVGIMAIKGLPLQNVKSIWAVSLGSESSYQIL